MSANEPTEIGVLNPYERLWSGYPGIELNVFQLFLFVEKKHDTKMLLNRHGECWVLIYPEKNLP